MKFEDKFKPGDIICSDRFREGKCMVVEELKRSYPDGEYWYICVDLILEDQGWIARERNSMRNVEYEWRIATDDDIVNYLSRFVKHRYKLGVTTDITISDDGMSIGETHLDAKQLTDLSRLINHFVAV